jgi:hypothetical protein
LIDLTFPQVEEGDVDQQLGRLNEVTNTMRLAIEILREAVGENTEHIGDLHQRTSAKGVEVDEAIDYCRAQLNTLREKMSQGPHVDLLALKREIDMLRREFVSLDQQRAVAEKVRQTGRHPDRKLSDKMVPKLSIPDQPPETLIKSPPPDIFGVPTIEEKPLPQLIEPPQPQPPQPQKMAHTARQEEIEEDTPEFATPVSIRSTKSQGPMRPVQFRVLRSTPKLELAPSSSSIPSAEMLQVDLEARVDSAIKMSIGGFLDRARNEIIKEVQGQLKVVNGIATKIDSKIDRDFVERMFNKIRVVIGELKHRIDQTQGTIMDWITREELREVLEKFAEHLATVKDTAGAKSKYRCLLCGKPRSHLAGMILTPALDEFDDFARPKETEKRGSRPNTRVGSAHTDRPMRSGTARPRDVIQLLKADAMLG